MINARHRRQVRSAGRLFTPCINREQTPPLVQSQLRLPQSFDSGRAQTVDLDDDLVRIRRIRRPANRDGGLQSRNPGVGTRSESREGSKKDKEGKKDKKGVGNREWGVGIRKLLSHLHSPRPTPYSLFASL